MIHLSALGRFLTAGAINTLAGYLVIFSAMALGIGPYLSNVAGYAVGLSMAFWFGRRWVFRSSGRLSSQAVRFLVAFLISYVGNIFVLWFSLKVGMPAIAGQVAAGAAYTSLMYALQAKWVFGAKE